MLNGGGVCAVLDYEVDQMTDYAADMAQRVVLPNHATQQVSPAFRKFVSGILTATRLPSTTILVGLNYLSRRMHMISNGGPIGSYKADEGTVWRMLTIALLLGSKFLDDNTFQNRSWAEVTNIPVAELNTLEHEWLEAIEYRVYVNLDESDDFNAWMQNWQVWRDNKNVQRKATLDRLAPLAPIDTNVQRGNIYQQPYNGYTKNVSREHHNPGYLYPHGLDTPAWSASNYDYPTPQLTPPSAADSGYNTPEYPSATGGGPRFDWTVYQPFPREYQQLQQQPYQPRVAVYNTPPYSGHYPGYNVWQGSSNDCQCQMCFHTQSMKSYQQTPLFGFDRTLHQSRQVAA